MLCKCSGTKDGITSGAPPPLSPEALAALGKRAWPLLPVQPADRRHLLRDEAALLIDELLVKVARGSGAIAVAMGECLDCLCTGAGPMRLGYANLGDYAREELSLAPRTANEWMKLARDLRTRPVLRAAVRSGRGEPQEGDRHRQCRGWGLRGRVGRSGEARHRPRARRCGTGR